MIRRLLAVAAGVAVVAAIVLGTWLQIDERRALGVRHAAVSTAPNRIDIRASIQHVDATAGQLTLRLLVVPRGDLGESGGLAPTTDLALLTSASVRGDLRFPAHARISSVDVPVSLSGGSVADYPFDAYGTLIEVAAQAGGAAVPVSMTLVGRDPLFTEDVAAEQIDGAASFDVGIERTTSVLLFALFMMAAMWALAGAVVLAAWFLVSRRRGLVWAALGWMAATLFALAAFRTTAPGTPPFGCLVDYAAFLWAEMIIATSLTCVVLAGARTEFTDTVR
ncbi:DUF4436 family protein [Actinomadura harenae]|uniref:DUF4436 domain-containing protein n=1 Tax=Actinomadura harenae TaxID=2483351 RepID=A0A3M2M789_9ACTN|nr:DUF4436 family protein [Actinomadura harenae]RMI45456.1 DUF4436 domain-containing protein [Actinomadura harenae]